MVRDAALVALVSLASILCLCFARVIWSRISASNMSNESEHPERETYSFRVRFTRSPTDTIECTESEVVLPFTGGGATLSLRNKKSDEPIKEAEHLALIGLGYASSLEAHNAGTFFETVIMVALARVRVGADFGYRAAKGLFTTEGLKWLEQQHGQRVLNDAHGLMVYATEPKPRFALSQAKMLRGASRDSFLAAFEAATHAKPSFSERERLAFSLFNASFFQPTADSRFLLLVMAVEALIEPFPRSQESQDHVKSLIAATQIAPISPADRDSMLGTLRWLKKESINQAGKRLVASRLSGRHYCYVRR